MEYTEEEKNAEEGQLYPEKKPVPIASLIKKELRFCRCKDTEKNVEKIARRYANKNSGVLNIGKARKVIHVLIMTNRNLLEK